MSEPASYERLVFKNASVYHYIRIYLLLDSDDRNFNAALFKQMVICALKDLYGEIGAAFPFDVLRFEEDTLTAVLRVYSSGLVKLWSALTLLGSYHSEPCVVRVTQRRGTRTIVEKEVTNLFDKLTAQAICLIG